MWKHPRYPSVGKWMWYSQTMECYLALKRNEPSSHEDMEGLNAHS